MIPSDAKYFSRLYIWLRIRSNEEKEERKERGKARRKRRRRYTAKTL
jgi:hypothetical protein